MVLPNKLNLTDELELAHAEERISKETIAKGQSTSLAAPQWLVMRACMLRRP